MPSLLRRPALFAGLAVLLHPLFFIIYRMSVFATVPRDDYAGFLLWLLGQPGGAFPDSPYCYRILSVVAAAPFTLLPVIPLTNTPAGLSPEYLKATGALSVLAFLTSVGTAVITHGIARRAGLDRFASLGAATLSLVLLFYTQFTAIDPLAVMLIAGAVALLHRPAAFAALLLLSVPVNEKVSLVLAIWLGLRWVTARADRVALTIPFATACAATAAYVVLVATLHLPGNSYQQDLSHYPTTVADNLAVYASARGLLLNLLPLAILLVLALVGRPVGPFSRRDALLVPVLAGVALVLTQFFQAGRIAMHAAPILVVPAANGIATWFSGSERNDAS